MRLSKDFDTWKAGKKRKFTKNSAGELMHMEKIVPMFISSIPRRHNFSL